MTPEEKAILDELGAVDAPPKADETERILAELGAVDAPPKVSPDVRAARWKELGITSREQAKQEAAEAKAKAAETMATGVDPDAPITDKLANSPLVAGSAAGLGALGRSAALNAPAHVGAIDETLRNYARRAVGRPSDGKTYGQRVEDVRAIERGLAEEYPIPTAIGSVVGGITSPANKLAAPVEGLSVARNIAQAVSTAGGQAALSSWLSGADAKNAATDAAAAAGMAGAGGLAAKGLQPVATWGGNKLKELGSFLGGRALGLERGTMNAITAQLDGDPTAAKELVSGVVEDAYRKGVIKPFQTTATGAAKFKGLIDETGKRIGAASEAIDDALRAQGGGIDLPSLQADMLKRAGGHAATMGGGAKAAVLQREADTIGKLVEQANNAGAAPRWSMAELLRQKRALNDAKIAANKATDLAGVRGYGELFDMLKERANAAAKQASPALADEFQKANTDYWRYMKLDKATNNAIAQSLGNNKIPLRSMAAPSAALGAIEGLLTSFPAATGSAARWGGGALSAIGANAAAPALAATAIGGATRGAMSTSPSELEQYLATEPTGEAEEEKRRKATQHFQRGN